MKDETVLGIILNFARSLTLHRERFSRLLKNSMGINKLKIDLTI